MLTKPRPTIQVDGLRRPLTANQLHRKAQGEQWDALDKLWISGPIYPGHPLPRRSVCSRLRELELHPDRLERLKARP